MNYVHTYLLWVKDGLHEEPEYDAWGLKYQQSCLCKEGGWQTLAQLVGVGAVVLTTAACVAVLILLNAVVGLGASVWLPPTLPDCFSPAVLSCSLSTAAVLVQPFSQCLADECQADPCA